MKIVFKQLLTEKTNTKGVIKQYKINAKTNVKDNSTKWKQKEVIDFNPERFDDYYPEIWEMYDSCEGSNNKGE